MAYTPTEWETGDVITAAKLNNIEDGIVANEEAIADAFVAPEVTAADQGKVLTVDSSGEWDAAYPDKETKWIVAKQYIDMQTQQPTGDFTILSGSVADLNYFPNVKVRVDLYIAGVDMHYSDMVFAPISHGYPIGGTNETYTFFCLTTNATNSTITSVPIWSLSYVPMQEEWILAQGELAMHT